MRNFRARTAKKLKLIELELFAGVTLAQSFNVRVRRDGIMSTALVEYIDGYFRQLEVELANDEGSFSLDQRGLIVLLEAGRDLYIQQFPH
ncbi:hypothetical protein P4S95_27095 [Aneurinibacillus aneurinilyticus]|uniref:hypothetical protein n=1 Tax=Aneurinibacillus aneurinilyticus TaxID=1391 RepID=UPI002E1E4A70|nr:hypothetical protein [Aneurinibacillus aneurinilyticus]